MVILTISAAFDDEARKHDNVSFSHFFLAQNHIRLYIIFVSFGVKLIASLIPWYVYVHTHNIIHQRMMTMQRMMATTNKSLKMSHRFYSAKELKSNK